MCFKCCVLVFEGVFWFYYLLISWMYCLEIIDMVGYTMFRRDCLQGLLGLLHQLLDCEIFSDMPSR